MAKQTFTTGQVLTAAQMTALQLNDYNQTVSAKVASYTLVASDAGTRITMSNASATTITVNTSLFAAGDTLFITNIGAGASTITAGTATVSTASSLILAQYDSGSLYFTSAGVAIWQKYDGAASAGKVVQLINATTSTQVTSATSTFADTNLTATITPTSASNKVLVIVNQNGVAHYATTTRMAIRLVRGATTILNLDSNASNNDSSIGNSVGSVSCVYLDSPATTSATTYKTQFNSTANSGTTYLQDATSPGTTSSILLMEVTP